MNKKTIEFYNKNAQCYTASTISIDVSKEIKDFLIGIPNGGYILDVGCGSGRDLKIFSALGYGVQGIDASEELVKIAKKNSGVPVESKNFLEIDYQNQFDGIWCMASLVHLKKDELQIVLEKLYEAMKPNAKLYASFKWGSGESYDEKGRFFSYWKEEEIKEIFKSIDKFKNINFELAKTDKLGRTNTQWLNVYATCNKPQLNSRFKS